MKEIISKNLMSELLGLNENETLLEVAITSKYSNMKIGVWYKYKVVKKEKYGKTEHNVIDCINVYELMSMAKEWISKQGGTSYVHEKEYIDVFSLCDNILKEKEKNE